MISVIVPVYNEINNLKRCITSICKQTYKDIEIIIVDDGSTDGSSELCDRLSLEDDRIVVIHKENGGLSSARNKGIEIAKGDFLGFVDSDDWISEDMYEHLIMLQKKYDGDVCQVNYYQTSKFVLYKESNEAVEVYDDKIEILEKYLKDGMKPIKSYPVWTKLYKKSCFDSIRFPVGQLYEDVVTNYDILANANRYVVSNKVGYFYFIKRDSITRGKFTKRDLDYVKVGLQIIERTENMQELYKLGEMTYGRFNFMCLCKMLKYDVDEDIDIGAQVDILIDAIRKNIKILLKSSMKLNRKIIMCIICLNKYVTKIAVKIKRV